MKKSKDVLRNLAIGAAAAIPYAGGSLAVLLDKTLPSEIEKRYNEFIDELEKNINELNIQIDQKRFESSQFYSVFVKVLNEVVSTHIEGKRRLFQNILVNTVGSFWECKRNDFFNMITFRLPLDAFRYLALLYRNVQEGGKTKELEMSYMIKKLPRDEYYLISIMTELARFRLTTGNSLSDMGKQFCDYIFTPINPGQAEMYVDDWTEL